MRPCKKPKRQEIVYTRQDILPRTSVYFFVNPQGRHDAYPIGGDVAADKAADGADESAAAGAVVLGSVLGAVGAVAGPVGVAVGAAVGAYTGALGGALGGMENRPDDAVRRSGFLVAVVVDAAEGRHAPAQDHLPRIAELLKIHHPLHVECAQGQWQKGEWVDFNPVSPPVPYTP